MTSDVIFQFKARYSLFSRRYDHRFFDLPVSQLHHFRRVAANIISTEFLVKYSLILNKVDIMSVLPL
jgi:hypothetical protein